MCTIPAQWILESRANKREDSVVRASSASIIAEKDNLFCERRKEQQPTNQPTSMGNSVSMETAALQFFVQYKKDHPTQVSSFLSLFLSLSPYFLSSSLSHAPRRVQLSLAWNQWSREQQKWVDHPAQEHVEILRNMEREKRVAVWEALGPYDECFLERVELELPVDREELGMLLPSLCPFAGSLVPSESLPLAGVQVLRLACVPKADDAWLRALASAGCGQNLTSLYLGSDILSSAPRLLVTSQKKLIRSFFLPAGLREGITDEGVRALASAGCGANLTHLQLIR